MVPSITETVTGVTAPLSSLSLRADSTAPAPAPASDSTPPSVGGASPSAVGWNKSAFAGYDDPDYKYARFLPSFDHDFKLPPLEPFEHHDPGLEAVDDPEPRAFLEGAVYEEMTPEFGSEVSGLQLHELDTKARQQLARFVAERGVVAFRDQDFIDKDPEWQLNDWGKFWGRLHVHPQVQFLVCTSDGSLPADRNPSASQYERPTG